MCDCVCSGVSMSGNVDKCGLMVGVCVTMCQTVHECESDHECVNVRLSMCVTV
jgi:hypothetical protein